MKKKNSNSIVIELLSEKPIAFSPTIARAVGSINAGLLLQQLLYWTGKGNDPTGWIRKSFDEMEEETALTRKQQIGAVETLVELGLIQTESRERGQWKTQRKFKVVGGATGIAKAVEKILLHVPKRDVEDVPKGNMGDAKRAHGPCAKKGCVLCTENTTTENTTEIALRAGKKEMDRAIEEVFDAFKKSGLCPFIKFNNTTQRDAAEEMVKKFTLEKTLGAIAYAAYIAGNDKYAPKLTTPKILMDRFGELINYKKTHDPQNIRVKIS